MRIGIMTGGGDAPGLNGIVEATCRCLFRMGHEVVGIEDGFQGIFERRWKTLSESDLEGLHQQAGTVLGTTNRCHTKGREEEFLTNITEMKIDGLIAAGGDGTFAGLSIVKDRVPIIGVPKTIDNDLSGTDITFGYDTACSVVAEAADALRATAQAHRRIIVIETMGRTAGWIALGGGMASYADVILIPELPFRRPELLSFVKRKQAQGLRGLICVVSEGAFAEGESPRVAFRVPGSPQEERYGGIAEALARWLESETGWEARHVVLGHLQRSRPPTTTDRFLTLAMGVEVAQLVNERAWGQAAVYRAGRVTRAPIAELMREARLVDPNHRWVQMTRAIGTFI